MRAQANVSGAGLEIYEQEPLAMDSELPILNTVLSPHIACNKIESENISFKVKVDAFALIRVLFIGPICITLKSSV